MSLIGQRNETVRQYGGGNPTMMTRAQVLERAAWLRRHGQRAGARDLMERWLASPKVRVP